MPTTDKISGKLSLLLDALAEVDGVLASGAFLGNHRVLFRSRRDYFLHKDKAKTILKSVKETFRHLRAHKLKAERLQWSFSDVSLHAVHVHSTTVGMIVEKTITQTACETMEETLKAFFAMESGVRFQTPFRRVVDSRTIQIRPERDSRTVEIEPLPDVPAGARRSQNTIQIPQVEPAELEQPDAGLSHKVEQTPPL